MKFLAIAVGGALGALLRYGVSGLTHRFAGGMFPWGTLAVNLAGCFLIGFLWEVFDRGAVSPNLRVFIFIGILGAFTTFSTYGLETINLFRDGETWLAVANMVMSNALGIILVFAGFAGARLILGMAK